MRKRFIAGAVCPQCNEIDKTVVYQQADDEVSECVKCGYKRFRSHLMTEAAETELASEDDASVVRWLNPKTDL
ncbi:MAG: metal-binding protein [Gammaproteobacteria bacterium]|nr:MAG: metal-binding protein [Gammaproteobacteria bacterium]